MKTNGGGKFYGNQNAQKNQSCSCGAQWKTKSQFGKYYKNETLQDQDGVHSVNKTMKQQLISSSPIHFQSTHG